MKISGASIRHRKERGEWAELRFMARASEHGLYVSKPWGDSRRYDFIVEHDHKFMRVQVKSTAYKRYCSYICDLQRGINCAYTSKEIDIVAAYVIPKDVWYIFPVEVTMRCRSVVLSPHKKTSKYAVYKEAWHLLRGEELPQHESASVAESSVIPIESNDLIRR